MIRRITIENFMAHKRTVLELSDGVTVITGPNNTGKSAIVEAIRSIAQNPPHSRTAIRHGEKNAAIRIELDSGEIVEWERTDKTALYKARRSAEADPETYAKFGRTPPDDIRALLRLDPVETETGPVDIHIGNQRYPIFLLDQSGSQAASFFAASTEAEYLLRMQQALKVRTDRSKSRHKELARECAEFEKELERLKPLDAVADVLRTAEALFSAIQEREKALPVLQACLEELENRVLRSEIKSRESSILATVSLSPTLRETLPVEKLADELVSRTGTLHHLQSKSGCLAGLCQPPRTLETENLDALLVGIEAALEKGQNLSSHLAVLKELSAPHAALETAGLANVLINIAREEDSLRHCRLKAEKLQALTRYPDQHETRELASVLESLRRVSLGLDLASTRREKLEILAAPPVLNDPAVLESTVQALSDLVSRCGRIEKRSVVHVSLRPVPEPLPVGDLTALLADAGLIREKIRETELAHKSLEEDIRRKKEEIERVLSEAGKCPLCGHNMDLEHFLEDGHA